MSDSLPLYLRCAGYALYGLVGVSVYFLLMWVLAHVVEFLFPRPPAPTIRPLVVPRNRRFDVMQRRADRWPPMN
jgi:hypothetical protein